MSHKDVEQIVSRAVVDEQFRELLFASPNEALAGHDLTADELRSATGGAAGAGTSPIGTKFDWSRIGYAPSNTN